MRRSPSPSRVHYLLRYADTSGAMVRFGLQAKRLIIFAPYNLATSMSERISDKNPARITLTVINALITDNGRGIARIDSRSRKLLNVVSGDLVKVRGKKRSSAATVWQTRSEEEGLSVIRLDADTMRNIGAEGGDKVSVTRVAANSAVSVVLAPLPGQYASTSLDFFAYAKDKLAGRPLIKGDVVPIAVLGYTFKLAVVATRPGGIVKVDNSTDVLVTQSSKPRSRLYAPKQKEMYLKKVMATSERIVTDSVAFITNADGTDLLVVNGKGRKPMYVFALKKGKLAPIVDFLGYKE